MVLPFAAIALLDSSSAAQRRNSLFLPSLAALAVVLRFSYLIARRALGVGVDVGDRLVVARLPGQPRHRA